ncbi:HAD-like domain [Pseudocohnilembus persalinus]|uniref:HAD-like domain n=1 Tax=Pseudocohnilembus persalinus TaxID=266149 RepID=A0A0V0QEZ5_PSEPJ|nr:HAD-like domain [Pseudocohnilembus persalinus]|eukprot:KRX00688.1 HAD-like domain [Pseudocohnilembus persalinus]
MSTNLKTVPLIATDIDGVVLHRYTEIPGAKEAIELLQKHEEIPFTFLTNRSLVPEKEMAKQINESCKIEENLQVDEHQIIMCQTPMKQLFQNYQNQNIPILIITREKCEVERQMNYRFYEDMGIQNYITGREYSKLYPQLVPLFSGIPQEEVKAIEERVSKRFNKPIDEIKKSPMQVGAIFLTAYPDLFEENIQIIMDLLSSEDGTIADKFTKGKRKHIPVYSFYNDLCCKAQELAVPRLLMGGFTEVLQAIFKKLYDFELEIIFYGKPQTKVFKFMEEYVMSQEYIDARHHHRKTLQQNNTLQERIELSNKYMIGDNPQSDIQGANNTPGWISILVKTGVYHGQDNDPVNPAKYVVSDFKEAVKLICKLENIPCNL